MDQNQLLQLLLSQGQTPMQSAMGQPQQPPASPGRQLGQGVLNGILSGMFTNHNKMDQSEDAPWMSGMATGGLDDSLMKFLQQYLGQKLF